jgi:hypothetical protein
MILHPYCRLSKSCFLNLPPSYSYIMDTHGLTPILCPSQTFKTTTLVIGSLGCPSRFSTNATAMSQLSYFRNNGIHSSFGTSQCSYMSASRCIQNWSNNHEASDTVKIRRHSSSWTQHSDGDTTIQWIPKTNRSNGYSIKRL